MGHKLESENAKAQDGSKKMKNGKGDHLKQHDKPQDKTVDTDSEELKDTKHTDKHEESASEKHNEDTEQEQKSEHKLESENAKAQDGSKKMKNGKGDYLKQHDKPSDLSGLSSS